jgi:hypothetical protein
MSKGENNIGQKRQKNFLQQTFRDVVALLAVGNASCKDGDKPLKRILKYK